MNGAEVGGGIWRGHSDQTFILFYFYSLMFFRHDDPTFCGSCPASPVEVPLKDSNVSDLSILLLTFKALFLPP